MSKVDRHGTKQRFYPFLVRNDRQQVRCPVLSPDGKSIVSKLPKGGILEKYTAKEIWLWDAAFATLVMGDGQQTILDSFEHAASVLESAKEELARLRAKERRGTIDDELFDYGELPGPDRRRIRLPHLVLQVVLAADDEGLEIGFLDLTCEHCGEAFVIQVATTRDRERADDTAERLCNYVRFGFHEVKKLLTRRAVACPLCEEQGYPYFKW